MRTFATDAERAAYQKGREDHARAMGRADASRDEAYRKGWRSVSHDQLRQSFPREVRIIAGWENS